MVSEDSTCTAAREASSVAAASCSREQRAEVCGVRHKFQSYIQRSGNKITILCQPEHQKIPPHPKHPRWKKKSYRNPMYPPAATINTYRYYVPHAYSAAHITSTHLPAAIDGVRTHASVSLMRTSAGVLCLASNGDWRSRSLKSYVTKGRGRSDRLGL